MRAFTNIVIWIFCSFGIFFSLAVICYFINPQNTKTRKKDGVVIGDDFVAHEVDPSTVGQFTGRTDDKDRKKIFEWDIVLHFGCCYKVCFENGQWVAVDNHGFWLELYDDVTYTVIGNVHDNPELLEE